jgi:recombination protein RecR
VPALPPVERLIASLRRLPGIGEKSATRLAFYLLSAPAPQVEELADAIARLKKEVVLCEECFDLTAASPCTLCRDPKRDATLLCVVEEPDHVLGGALSPIDGMGPEQLRIAELLRRVEKRAIREVIVATNPNAEGDATAHYLAERLRPQGVKVSRIASGMPLGGDLEYADQVTIGRSLQHRRDLE